MAISKKDIPARSRMISPAGMMLLIVCLICSFGFNFYEMWLRWFPAWKRSDLGLYDRIVEGESYYTHGPLVLLVSIFIAAVLMRYTRIELRINKASRACGVLGVVFFMLVHLAASLARVNFISGFAFVGVIASLILLVWGWDAIRRLWFPVVFLVFLVPLPEVTIAQVNFRMKLLATHWGVDIANLMNVVVYQQGNRVFIEGDKSLIIANVCNGLRTLISLVAFGALYTYVCRLRGWRRLLLFAMSVPVAFVANTIRIVSLIVVADLVNAEVAGGWYHDMSSVLIFILAFMFMFLVEKIIIGLSALFKRPVEVQGLFATCRRDESDSRQLEFLWSALSSWRVWVAGAAIIIFSLFTGLLNRVDPPKGDLLRLENSLPVIVDINGNMMRGESLPIDKRTLTILENPGYLNRRYMGSRGFPLDVTVFFSKDNRKGIHPPDLCLEGIGFSIVSKRRINIGLVPCREIIFENNRRQFMMIYTYKCGRRYTLSFWEQQTAIFLNGLFEGNSTGAMIRVSTQIGLINDDIGRDEATRMARKNIHDMMEVVLPCLDRALP